MADNPKQLNKTIEIDGASYDVTATVADKVQGTLKINKINLDGSVSKDQNVEYNGEYGKTIDLVTAAGGRFSGPIRVPENTNTNINKEAVLNYQDIKNVILQNVKNNAIVYNWNGSEQSVSFDNSINSISIVQGLEDNVSSFASYNNERYINKQSYLPTYLYIGSQQNKVYYGTADSTEAALLAINSAGVIAEAGKLTTPRNIKINLSSSNSASFDGTKDIDDESNAPGVLGVLPLANGGLGGNISTDTKIAAEAETYINGTINENTTAVTDDTWMLFRQNETDTTILRTYRKKASILWNYIAGKIRSAFGFSTNNVLSVANGGTGQTDLDGVTVGKSKTIKVSYKASTSTAVTDVYSNITIAPSTSYPDGRPTGGTEGDIMILF